MDVTLDSSVLVSAFLKGDEHWRPAKTVLERHFNGQYLNVTSLTVPVEVVCSIARRAGKSEAGIAKSQLGRWEELGFMRFVEVTRRRAEKAEHLGVRLKLKAMDAIVVQAASERGCPLITFDSEMAQRASKEVKVLTAKDF